MQLRVQPSHEQCSLRRKGHPPLSSSLSRPLEHCEGRPAPAGVRNLGLDDPTKGRPDSHCNFDDRSLRACRPGRTGGTVRHARHRRAQQWRRCYAEQPPAGPLQSASSSPAENVPGMSSIPAQTCTLGSERHYAEEGPPLEPAFALRPHQQRRRHGHHDGQGDGQQYPVRLLVDDQVHAQHRG